MKKRLLFVYFMASAGYGFAQCPFAVKLNSEGAYCAGSALLSVSSTDTLTQIIWNNGNTALLTVKDTLAQKIVTVAGGNGSGTAANQTGLPKGVFVDKSGYLYVLTINQVQRFPPGSSGGSSSVIVAGGNGQGSTPNQFDNATGLFVDAGGNCYVADTYNNRIQKWAPGAATGIPVAGNGTQGSAANELTNPGSVYLDAGGNIYVGDNGNNRVQKFPAGSTTGTNGVTVAGGNGAGAAANQLNGIDGLFIDGSGNLYVADFENHRVQKFPPGSTQASNGITVAGGNGAGPTAGQLDFPDGLYVDGSGNLYVADQINDRIQEWTPGASSGKTVAGGNGEGDGENQLFWPKGVYVDGSGNIYICDYRNNRVQEWTLSLGIDNTYRPATPGSYTAVVTDSAGCTVTTNAVIIQPEVPSSVVIGVPSTTICAGDTIVFVAAPTNGGYSPSFQWQVNGLNLGTGSDTLVDGALADADRVSCILTSSLTCTLPADTSNTITMTVHPAPTVNAGDDTTIAPGKSLQLSPVITGTITAYQWTPATGLDNPFQPDPIATPAVNTVYRLTVASDDGCKASGKVSIGVFYPLQMPGAFTPNGDGKNDLFIVPPSGPQKIKYFSVYNRWGDRVFMTTDSSTGWDGNFNNRQAPTGTYVWEMEYEDPLTGKDLKAMGTVVLIR
jgi:gliding motility-associated-like protein